MSRFLRPASVLLCALSLGARPAPAQGVDTGTLLTAGAATTAASVLLDDAARTRFAADPGEPYGAWSDAGDVLGRGRWVVAGTLGTYGLARLAGREPLAAAAGRTLAGLVAAGAANGALKVAVGRQRPYGDDPLRFDPVNWENAWQSFPSGHVVTVFALASAVSEEAGRPWVTGAGYGAAALVAWSRVHENKHWLSDVIGGATVGAVTSRFTVRWLRRRAGATEAPSEPTLVLLSRGIAVQIPVR